MKHTLSVLVENQPGILSKVAGLFSRRGFNIDSLAVGVTEDTSVSRMTIVVNGDEHTVEQVEKQLNKLIQVIKVRVLQPNDFISQELSLVKVNCRMQNRGDVMKIAELMQARIVDVTTTCLTLEFCDTEERTETLIDLLRPFGFKEIVRAGAIAIEKGNHTASSGRHSQKH
ncbi:MAG: acetolactate synthase small subunit [Oscillospiraceae bacterium]|nr:acetolactate synthase small subunit [Oscillospiraceae bacterium]